MLSVSKIRKAATLISERDRIDSQLSKMFPVWSKVRGTNKGKNMKRAKANGSNGEVKAKASKGKPSRARQLAGKYMAATRSLSAADKKAVKALRIEKGIGVAIKAAKDLQGRASV